MKVKSVYSWLLLKCKAAQSGAIILMLVLLNTLQWLTLSNVAPQDTPVQLTGSTQCYEYLYYRNGHFLRNLATKEIVIVYIRPIVPVRSCGP